VPEVVIRDYVTVFFLKLSFKKNTWFKPVAALPGMGIRRFFGSAGRGGSTPGTGTRQKPKRDWAPSASQKAPSWWRCTTTEPCNQMWETLNPKPCASDLQHDDSKPERVTKTEW